MTRLVALLFLLLPLHAAGPVRVAFDSKVVTWRGLVENAFVPPNKCTTLTLIASSGWMGAVRAGGLYPGKILRANLACGPSFGGTNGAGDSTSSLYIGAPQNPIIIDAGGDYDVCNIAQAYWKYNETGANGGLGQVSTANPVYLKTGISANGVSSWTDDVHFSAYVMGEGANGAAAMGSFDGGLNAFLLVPKEATLGQYTTIWGFVGYPTDVTSDGKGFFLGTRTSSAANGLAQYRGGVLTGTASAASGSPNAFEIYVLCFNNNGSPASYLTNLCGGYTIGRGLTSAQQLSLYNATQQFETLLGRQK
jgi:hypothetical protein